MEPHKAESRQPIKPIERGIGVIWGWCRGGGGRCLPCEEEDHAGDDGGAANGIEDICGGGAFLGAAKAESDILGDARAALFLLFVALGGFVHFLLSEDGDDQTADHCASTDAKGDPAAEMRRRRRWWGGRRAADDHTKRRRRGFGQGKAFFEEGESSADVFVFVALAGRSDKVVFEVLAGFAVAADLHVASTDVIEKLVACALVAARLREGLTRSQKGG